MNCAAERYALYEQPVEALVPQLYATFPDLREQPYARVDGERDPAVDRHVYDVASHLAIREAHADVADAERRRLALADLSMPLNPVHAFQSGMNRIAGTEATAFLAFGDAIVAAVRTRLHRILEHAWSGEPVDRAGFVALSRAVPEDLVISEPPPALAWLTLLGWTGVAVLLPRRS